MPIYMIMPRYSHNYAQFRQLLNSNLFTHRRILILLRGATSETYGPLVYSHHINLHHFYTYFFYFGFYFLLWISISKIPKILSIISIRSHSRKWPWRDWQPLIALVASSYRFVQVRGTWAWPPNGLIPWFSKTEGNTYATLLHHPFLFKGKPTHAQEVVRRISGAVAGEIYAKSRHTKYPSQTLIPHITLFAICLSFSSPPLHPCRFIRPFSVRLVSLASWLLVCWIDCLSRWLKLILNFVTSPIPTIMILLALW